jgi:hypothetical protein
VDLKFDKFMNRNSYKTLASDATSLKAAAKPTPDVGTPINVVTDDSGIWESGDAGDYFFAVSSINRYGESALQLMDASATTVAAGKAIDFKFTSGGGTYAPTGFRIYRSEKDASASGGTTKFYPLFDVTTAQLTAGYDGGAAGIIRDRNRILPDTDQAFALEMSDEILSFKQLLPLMKMDLARISPAIRFMILLYGTPILYQPKKMVRFINIGTTVAS